MPFDNANMSFSIDGLNMVQNGRSDMEETHNVINNGDNVDGTVKPV